MKYNIRPRLFQRAGIFVKWFVAMAVGITFICGLTWCMSEGCEGDHQRARQVLQGAGYSKIETGGAHRWRCGREDGESNTFSAIGPSGRYVEGVVCCGYNGCNKGCTIRIEP